MPDSLTPFTPPTPLLDDKVRGRLSFLINLAYFGFWLGVTVLAFRLLFLWMLPFVLAFVVAAVLQQPLHFLVRKTRVSKKVFSVALVVLIIFLLSGLVAFIGWRIVLSVTAFFADNQNVVNIQNAITDIGNSLQQFINRLSYSLPLESVDALNDAVASLTKRFIELLTGWFTGMAGGLMGFTAKQLPVLLVSFIIWVISSIFLSIDFQRVMAFFMRQVPASRKELVRTTRELCSNTVFKLIRAYLLLMFITFVELSIGLSLLRVPYAIPLSALISVVDILPVLGVGTIVIPWALLSLVTGNLTMFVGLGIMYIVITVLRNVLEPRLVSHQIGLSPLVTLFFMYLGLQAIGVFGMFLFPVTVMVLKQLQENGHIHLWK